MSWLNLLVRLALTKQLHLNVTLNASFKRRVCFFVAVTDFEKLFVCPFFNLHATLFMKFVQQISDTLVTKSVV